LDLLVTPVDFKGDAFKLREIVLAVFKFSRELEVKDKE
jgi:hypothetical protein